MYSMKMFSRILLICTGLSSIGAAEKTTPFTALGMIPELQNAVGEYVMSK